MPNNPLFYTLNAQAAPTNLRDQIQIALAIADAPILKSLLVNCIPPITEPDRVGTVSTEIGVPTQNQQSADGILHFEAIKCVLADSVQPAEMPSNGGWTREGRELARLTQHESELHTLGHHLGLASTVSLLAESGFSPKQIEAVLRLPHDGWHKSWWYAIGATGHFTIPFLRHLRILHYPDGTYTLQYKDFFEQDKPPCFTRLAQKVLVMIRSEGQGFGETLRQINYQREALATSHTILICQTLSELEAQAFVNQGVSVYPASELVLPIHSNCLHCGRNECPMNGMQDSMVALCYGFLPQSEFV